jgi:DNA-binding PadR family transcriptional regulator
MFRFSHGGHDRQCGPRGRGRHEFDPERFFHWVERLNAGERGRGGGRSRRMFDGGELRLVLLKLIQDEPRHGYELIKAIEDLTGGAYAPSPGVVYPALQMLAELGFIAEQASDSSRKRFAITSEGAMHVEENREQIEALIARLTAVGEHRNRPDQQPIRRAMGNLREAVRGRMMQGGLSEDTLHDIAALLDEAAQKIERLK